MDKQNTDLEYLAITITLSLKQLTQKIRGTFRKSCNYNKRHSSFKF